MKKIMLVIDDYSELVFLETFLKKLGFDVLGLNKDSAFNDSVLGFFPDFLIATAKGRQVDGSRLSQKVVKKAGIPKVILLHPAGQAPQLSEGEAAKVDGFIDSPVDPMPFIRLLARLGQMDPALLSEKYAKIRNAKMGPESGFTIVKDGDGTASAESSPVQDPDPERRKSRYEAFLNSIREEPVDAVLPHERMAEHVEKLREHAEKEGDSDDLLEQKRQFVRAMFKK